MVLRAGWLKSWQLSELSVSGDIVVGRLISIIS